MMLKWIFKALKERKELPDKTRRGERKDLPKAKSAKVTAPAAGGRRNKSCSIFPVFDFYLFLPLVSEPRHPCRGKSKKEKGSPSTSLN